MKTLVTIICNRIGNAGITLEKNKAVMHPLAIACTICFIVTYVTQVIALLGAKGDIDRLFECFSVISFCGMGLLKLTSLYRNQEHWSFLLNKVNEIEKDQYDTEPHSAEYESDDESSGFPFTQHIVSYSIKFQTISTLLARMYGSTLVIFILSPFAEYVLLKDSLGTKDWPHILPGWTPLDYLSFFGYLFTIVIETVAATYCVCVHVAFDLASVGVMIFICGQFSLIREYSERIGGKGEHWKLSERRDERAHHRIVRCYKIHVMLISLSTRLSALLKNILGVYFFLATLTLCSVAVRLNSELSSMQLVSLLQYMSATLTQLFLYCHYGDNVQHESSINQGEGPFGAAHWCLRPRVRRELTLLGMGMLLPKQFYAGPFITLNLPSFIQVVRTAYSYYAVIRK